MSSDVVSIVMDVLVLGGLAVTILYILRLSRSLNAFKNQRKEFDSVITNLLSSIDKAERSVQVLKQVSAQEAGQLESLISQSKALSEELQIINDASESMAKRLERVAETNRKIVRPDRAPESDTKEKISSPVHPKTVSNDKRKGYTEGLKRVGKASAANVDKEDLPSFMIKDSEYDEGDLPDDDFESEAERELFQALRSRKHNLTGQD